MFIHEYKWQWYLYPEFKLPSTYHFHRNPELSKKGLWALEILVQCTLLTGEVLGPYSKTSEHISVKPYVTRFLQVCQSGSSTPQQIREWEGKGESEIQWQWRKVKLFLTVRGDLEL